MDNVAIFIIISLLWSGMIFGISFLEAWVKFKTPSLKKEIGLDVGRTVFRSFHLVQWLFLGVLTFVFLERPLMIQGMMLFSIFFLLGCQTFWIFPKLCSDVDLIRFGHSAQHPHQHFFYGAAEILKVLSLLLGSTYLIFKLIHGF